MYVNNEARPSGREAAQRRAWTAVGVNGRVTNRIPLPRGNIKSDMGEGKNALAHVTYVVEEATAITGRGWHR